ncbi:tail fiber domain-containing protein, partial [bacterium]|nr:tail fiber domain-containing protein [bacterium]
NSSTTSTYLAGNLLLGTTSDTGYQLNVNGTSIFTNQLYINPTNTGTTGLDVASDTIRFRSDNLEGFKRQLEITMGSGTLVQLTAKGYGANYGTDLAFYTATTGGTNASPGIYITGTNNRVGIKTGTPSYDLDVSGTFGVSGSASFTGSLTSTRGNNTSLDLRSGNASQYTIFTLGRTSTDLAISSSASSGQFFVGSVAGDGWIGATNGTIGLGNDTSGIATMLVKGGNVLIGDTTTTNYRLIISTPDSGTSNFGIGVFNSAGSTLLRIRNDGAFFTGTAGASPYNNTYTNVANVYIGSDGVMGRSTASSKRFKDNIQDWLDNGLNTILALKPKTFTYKADYYKNPNLVMLGLIAEEVAEICPYLAEYENEDRTGQVENV